MKCSEPGDGGIPQTQDIELVRIVAVSKAERIFCMAPNSKKQHTVYKRIHIVRQGETILLLGADCFNMLFGSGLYTPKYSSSSSNGKLLTSAERELLTKNTEELIALFSAEFEAEQRQARQAEEERAAREREIEEQRAAQLSRDQEQRKAEAANRNAVTLPPARTLVRPSRRGIVSPETSRWTPPIEPMWRASFPLRQQILTAVSELAGRTGIEEQRIHHIVSSVNSRGQLAKTSPVLLAEEWGRALGLRAEDVLQFMAEAGFTLCA